MYYIHIKYSIDITLTTSQQYQRFQSFKYCLDACKRGQVFKVGQSLDPQAETGVLSLAANAFMVHKKLRITSRDRKQGENRTNLKR